MYDNYNYPEGTDNERAPWNSTGQPYKKIKVVASITLSKEIEIEVNDYATLSGNDEEGNKFIAYDFSECDLKTAVRNQKVLPDEAYRYAKNERCSNELKDWIIDDFEVMLNE